MTIKENVIKSLKNGMNRTDVAYELRIPESRIAYWVRVNSKEMLRMDVLLAIEKVLNIPISEIIEE